MDIAEKLRKAAGLFVELPPETEHTHGLETRSLEEAPLPTPPAETRTVEQMVRASDGPNLDEIQISHEVAPALVTSGGSADFSAIYAQAGLPDVPFSAEQMRDMLISLPAELPLAMRRQTVKVTLGAMGKSLGATPDTIVADAGRKMAALAAYAASLSEHTKTLVAAAESDIAGLQAQIEAKQQSIASAQATLTEAVQRCNAESDHLDDVLEFFSLDVPPSKHGSGEEAGRRQLNG